MQREDDKDEDDKDEDEKEDDWRRPTRSHTMVAIRQRGKKAIRYSLGDKKFKKTIKITVAVNI